MVYEEFASLLSEICSHSPLAAGRPLLWTIIANPKAGGFTIKSRWKKHYAMLLASAGKAKKNPQREGGPSQTAAVEGGSTGGKGLVCTKAAGHAGELTGLLISEAGRAAAPKNGARPFYLIITAGGDGTSLEVMTSLYHAPAEVRRNFAILRLPMGTGNDGADAWELDEALDLLIEPAELAMQRALRLKTASGKGPFLAFNILSVGLDAFVTHMTNKMKGKLPGDSYKLWVDIASLLYDRIYKVDYMDVRARDGAGKEVKAFREKLLLLAVGESGKRTYGSRKLILPDERNVCAVKQMSLFRKLALKEMLNDGTHADKSEAILWNASAVEFSARHPILAQMDGETVLLNEKDFPAVIELSEPVIQILVSSK
ncbi:MAG: diacylglycerol kinase [Treponema sp.]|nr:diacylglycerol kinase [Treponema sp.]